MLVDATGVAALLLLTRTITVELRSHALYQLRLNILAKLAITSTGLLLVLLSSAGIAETQTSQSKPAAPAPGAQTPGTQNVPPPNEPERRGGFVPGQKRPPGDPAQIARGKTLFAINCRGCHGADLRGGDLGGPNLLRSQVALSDRNGELIVRIIHGSRQKMGMPAIGLNDADANAVAAYVRSVIETIQEQGKPPSAGREPPSILIGNASEGKAYFATKCSGCHSATNDLSKIASRIPDPMRLQDAWLAGGTRQEEGEPEGAASTPRTVTATISLPSGETVEGKLVRIDDFLITLALADGSQKTFRRTGDTPNVVIHDPLKAHRDLLSQYSDRDIHDVTAYLVTLK
jgi:cytochrome c oxidase cbb3-type subunit 3